MTGDTWFGVLPENWSAERFRIAARLIDKKVTLARPDRRYIGLENVESWTGRLSTTTSVVVESTVNEFAPGDVLFGKLRPYLAKALLAESHGVCSTEFLVLRPRNLLPQFLLYALLSKDFIDLVNAWTYGVKMPRASWGVIGNLVVPVPPLKRQAAIANFLDRETAETDALVAKYERLIAILEEKRVALIMQAVTKGLHASLPMKDSGIAWFGRVPANWEVLPLRRVLSTRSGNLLPEDIHEEGREGDIAIYGSTEVIGYTAEAPNLARDSILLARVGQYAGKVSVAKAPAWVSDNALIATVNEAYMSLEYAALLLRSLNLNDYATKTAQPLLTGATVRAQIAPVPPLDAQTSMISFVYRHERRIDALKRHAQQAISLLREHRSALITAAVTGQMDVTNYRSRKQPVEVAAS